MKFVRHGQSEFNVRFAATRQDPGIPDAPLTPLGREQAEEAAERLKGHDFKVLISSPYTRAIQTAQIINKVLDLPHRVDRRINEWAGFSCDIGTPRDDLKVRYPDIDFDHLDPIWWPNSEEERHVQARADAFWEDHKDHPDRDHTLCVSHWGFIRTLTGIAVPNCAILSLSPNREATVLHP